jgi:glycogen synthase
VKDVLPRLRILHVVASYYPAVRYGGPIRSVHGLAAALARHGHDVHVYTTNVYGD